MLDKRLECVVLPVSDVERSKVFYGLIGFHEDHDQRVGIHYRVVQYTPPGSKASIVFGVGVTDAAPGSVQGLLLSVGDISIARADLIDRGIDVTGVFHDIDGVFYHTSPEHELPGPDPAGRDHRSFARFSDPDGNAWVLQEVKGVSGFVPPDGPTPVG